MKLKAVFKLIIERALVNPTTKKVTGSILKKYLKAINQNVILDFNILVDLLSLLLNFLDKNPSNPRQNKYLDFFWTLI